MQRETKFKNRVKGILEHIPELWFTKIQQLVKRGDPDFLMCYKGKLIAWELKTDTGKLSALQEYTLNKIKEAGGIAMVVTPASLNKCLQEVFDVTLE